MSSFIKECRNYWIVRDDEGYGNALVLRAAWSSRYLDLVAKYKVKIIRVNEHGGWHGSDLSFLLTIPGIHGVDVMSDRVTDVSPIFQMKRLKTVSLYTKAKVAGDFTQLTHLQRVGLGWRSVFQSLYHLDTLRRINIIGYPEEDLTRWAYNTQLERLKLQSRRLECLRGIERFPNIRQLHLYGCRKLQSLDEIGASSSIQELAISHCANIRDWSPISRLSNLRVLEIEDCHDIDSVMPFARCRQLERLQISRNTTILNGDLSSLKALPNLRTVLLARKKHYSHTDDELEQGRVGVRSEGNAILRRRGTILSIVLCKRRPSHSSVC